VFSLLKRWYKILWMGQIEGELNSLDPITKYFVITRAVIDIITIISVSIAGLLAVLANKFNPLIFILCLIGLFLAHSGADLLNDYYDYKNGLDTKNYFRAKYLPHPILEGLISEKSLLRLIISHYLIALIIATYLTILRGPLILLFTILGIFFGYAYQAGPKLKYFALGEISTLIVWGPLMVGGSYFAITGEINFYVFLISIPYALMVMLILLGKHMDKYESDKKLGVKTLPVLIGMKNSKILSIIVSSLAYLFTLLFALIRLIPLTSLLVFFTFPFFIMFVRYYLSNENKIWYVAASLWLNRFFGIFFVLGLFLSVILRIFGIII